MHLVNSWYHSVCVQVIPLLLTIPSDTRVEMQAVTYAGEKLWARFLPEGTSQFRKEKNENNMLQTPAGVTGFVVRM